MTLASFLFDQLHRHGVRHVFGIPGDFALNLYEALEADGRFSLVRFSHEPAVGFDADGCARITGGLGVCVVTYGAGGLNMVNAVACAYAEESPLVVISGGPGRAERRRGIHVHHEVKSFESQFKVLEVTGTAPSSTTRGPRPRTLPGAGRLINAKRPVYLGAARHGCADIVPPHDDERRDDDGRGAVNEAVAEIALFRSAAVVLIVGVEVHRFQLRDAVVRLAEMLGLPVASISWARGFSHAPSAVCGTYPASCRLRRFASWSRPLTACCSSAS